jgi:hypothetical protein
MQGIGQIPRETARPKMCLKALMVKEKAEQYIKTTAKQNGLPRIHATRKGKPHVKRLIVALIRANRELFSQPNHTCNPPRSPMSDIQTPVSLLQLLVVLTLGFLVIRWIFFSSAPSSQSTRGHAAGRSRVNPAQVEQVAQMFPQLDRRDIMWDLQRNGGNVQATTERILSGRVLEVVRP